MKFLCVALAVLALLPRVFAEEAERTEDLIRKSIVALDDDSYAVRKQARAELRKIGLPAFPLLREAAKSDSPERRFSARELLHAIGRELLTADFERFGKLPEAEMEVEEGMWLVARILDPDLTRKGIADRLDRMAGAVRKELGNGVVPAKAPPADVVAALRKVLGEQFGLKGDFVTYDHPDNSSIHRVIERKKGLPILLSEIAVAVGRRLEVPLVGLAIPGRYMFKYEGKRAPEGHARADIIVNPFEGWKITSIAELEREIIRFDRRSDLEPAAPRMTIVRMLNNMSSDAIDRRELRLAKDIHAYQAFLVPERQFVPRFPRP